jgi:hypothetical protein
VITGELVPFEVGLLEAGVSRPPVGSEDGFAAGPPRPMTSVQL